ncbi:glycosyltransferase [Sphingobium sp. TomMM35A]
MKVLHAITALSVGGAETMLAKLVEYERMHGFAVQSSVASLMPLGARADRIRASGTPLYDCGLRGAFTLLPSLFRLRAVIRQVQPDLIMAWMYHAHIAATLASGLMPRKIPLIWNVRHSIDDIRQEKPALRAVVRTAALLSRLPHSIIYNSHAAAGQHQRLGFHARHAMVIPNGFDPDLFRPREGAREQLAAKLGIDPGSLIIGMAARNHPMKDAANLAEAVLIARQSGVDAHLILTGEGMDRPTGRLAELLKALPADRVTLRGHDGSLAELLQGLDLLVLPSAWGEGFPNILGEAMACGIACIATDVGDSGGVLGGTGIIVPPRDAAALADGIVTLDRMEPDGRRQLGAAARDRVEQRFSMSRIAGMYSDLYRGAGGAGAPQNLSRAGIGQAQVM